MRRPRYLRVRFRFWRGRVRFRLLNAVSLVLWNAGILLVRWSNRLRLANNLPPVQPLITRYPRSGVRFPRSTNR